MAPPPSYTSEGFLARGPPSSLFTEDLSSCVRLLFFFLMQAPYRNLFAVVVGHSLVPLMGLREHVKSDAHAQWERAYHHRRDNTTNNDNNKAAAQTATQPSPNTTARQTKHPQQRSAHPSCQQLQPHQDPVMY